MVGARGGEGVGPFCEIRGEEGARKSKVYDARAPNEGHGKPSKYARNVKERKPQLCGPVEVRRRGPGSEGSFFFFLFFFFFFFKSCIRC